MNLHERWYEYTNNEIIKIKKEKCSKCRYSKRFGALSNGKDTEEQRGNKANMPGNLYCDYLMMTGHKRGVRPENCDHYKEGNDESKRNRRASKSE